MHSKIFVISCLLIIPVCCFSQNNADIDSLLTELKSTGEDTNKIRTLNKLFAELEFKDSAKAKEYINNILELSIKIDYKRGIAQSYFFSGILFIEQDDYKSALYHLFRASRIYKEINFRKGIADSYHYIGITNCELGLYPDALKYLQISLKIREDLDDKKGIACSYNNIGDIHAYNGNNIEALKYVLKSLEIRKEISDKIGIANSYNNLGNIYTGQGNYIKALEYYNKSLEIINGSGDKKRIAILYNNIGDIYTFNDNNTEALKYYQQSYDIFKKFDDKRIITISLINLGTINNKLKNQDKAIKYFLKSLAIAEEINTRFEIRYIYHSIAKIYAEKNDYKNAYKYHCLYKEISDSLFNEEKNKQITEMETKYQVEKKENEIVLQNIKLKEQKYLLWFIISISLILLLSTCIFFIQKTRKARVNKELVRRNLEIAESEIKLRKANEDLKIINQNLNNLSDIQKNEKGKTEKYLWSTLTEDQKEQLTYEILNMMENEKIYLRKDITIEKFASLLNINSKYISQVINEKFNQNYSNFINEYRIKEARKLLSDEKKLNYTIEAIASEVGFSSIPSFNNSFKKFTGTTPSLFIKLLPKIRK